jgi:hypothetical protein
MVDSPYLQNFLDFLLDIRNRIYDLIPDTPPTEPIVIETRDQDFQRPQTATPIGLGLLQTCRQVHAEFHSRIFARTFRFRNLDTLLALLARWPLARDHMRHVDLRLVSGPQGFDLHALLALSELPLDTLTIRCAEFQGRHVNIRPHPQDAGRIPCHSRPSCKEAHGSTAKTSHCPFKARPYRPHARVSRSGSIWLYAQTSTLVAEKVIGRLSRMRRRRNSAAPYAGPAV